LSDRNEERIIALAGVFQAAGIVAELAKTGTCDMDTYNTLLNSLFNFNPSSTLDVYGNNIQHLHQGLTVLSQISNNQLGQDNAETIRYALSLLALQKQLDKNPGMLDVISSRLNHINYNKTHFSDNNSDIASSISGLYQDTISTLKFRIQVTGNMLHLKNTPVSDKIRVMLFSGIRSAMLWRQLGGTKWQIIFGRGNIEKYSKDLLEDIAQSRH
jgi:high frequency lysogenization protein